MAKTKLMRVPVEFEGFLNPLSEEFSKQTGLPFSNTATMRRIARSMDGRFIVKGTGFDIAIIGRTRKRK